MYTLQQVYELLTYKAFSPVYHSRAWVWKDRVNWSPFAIAVRGPKSFANKIEDLIGDNFTVQYFNERVYIKPVDLKAQHIYNNFITCETFEQLAVCEAWTVRSYGQDHWLSTFIFEAVKRVTKQQAPATIQQFSF